MTKFEKALKAVTEFVSDDKLQRHDTQEGLEILQEEIEMMLDALTDPAWEREGQCPKLPR